MTQEIPDEVKRWTAKRRQALILQLVRGEPTAVEAARKYDLTVREVEEWREKAMAAMENALRSRVPEALQQLPIGQGPRRENVPVQALDDCISHDSLLMMAARDDKRFIYFER